MMAELKLIDVSVHNGNIDWDNFFSALKNISFDGTVTLEAPAHLPVGVDSETLNRSLRFIKKNLL